MEKNGKKSNWCHGTQKQFCSVYNNIEWKLNDSKEYEY